MPTSYRVKPRPLEDGAENLLAEWISSSQDDAKYLLPSQNSARIIDLRSPERFRKSFIPGSYSVPDQSCWEAAKRIGLFHGRRIFLMADSAEQIAAFESGQNLSGESELMGCFGAESLDVYRRSKVDVGRISTIDSGNLADRVARGVTVLAITSNEGASESCDPSALRFHLKELPLALDGLPVKTALCISASSDALATFVASLLWNLGFHKIGCLATL